MVNPTIRNTSQTKSIHDLRVVGLEQEVPLVNGGLTRYINFDNAASTPSFECVNQRIQEFLPFYSSVHRGTGYKSQLSTRLYDEAHDNVAHFFGADTSTNTVIFTKNTSEAINKLSYRFPLTESDVVLCTQMEHHSNDLPWRAKAQTIHIGLTEEGALDMAHLALLLNKYSARVKLVCVSGASNVTGFIQPIHQIARMAHAVGAKIVVDAAQLAPHRAIDIKADKDPEHIDFLIVSAHKMYAPFGIGVLIGPKDLFLQSAPEYSGGGTVSAVTLDDIIWAGLPDREEVGSPNVVGAIAFSAALEELQSIGMDQIAHHENELTRYALSELKKIESITLYGSTNEEQVHNRVGVIPFNISGISHFKVAAALSYEWGIGVRNGCFCAHPYVVNLLKLDTNQVDKWRRELQQGYKAEMPGMVRISFGCYNTFDDVDYLIKALSKIASGEFSCAYKVNPANGEYTPEKVSNLS